MGWKAVKQHYRIGHTVHMRKGMLCIGSSFINDILVVSPGGDLVKRCDRGNAELDRYQREFDADPELLRKLIAQPDVFERSITVYTFDDGEIIECQCEELGWPNCTHDGRLMYENRFTLDREQAKAWAIRNAESWVSMATTSVMSAELNLEAAKGQLELAQKALQRAKES